MGQSLPHGRMKFSWVLPGSTPAPEGVWLRVNFLRKWRLCASRSTGSLVLSLKVGDGPFFEHWLFQAFVLYFP